MAPKRFPWSVSAMAGKPSPLAASTSLSSWAAPSRRLYSEWTWRWTKSPRRADLPASLREAPITYPLASPDGCGSPTSELLPLDGARRLGGDVEHDSVDALHLVDDAARDSRQQVVGQAGPVRRHRVLAGDGAERDHLGIGAEVTHDAHGAHGEQHREGLPERTLEPGLADLLLHDEVRAPEDGEPVLRHLAQHADGEARAREGLAPDDLRREAQQCPHLSHLVLEELAEGLHQLEVHPLGEAAHVVMRLDRGRRALERDGLDHVGIHGALREPGDAAELARLLLEDRDELVADGLALDLGIDDILETIKESPTCIHMDQIDLECIAERLDDVFALAGAEQAIVHEETRELIADGLVDQRRDHGRVHTAGERADHAIAADPLTNLRDGRVHERGHGPIALHPAGPEEVREHGLALRGVGHLRMELHRVEAPVGIGHGRHRTVGRGGKAHEAGRRPQHGVTMAHPHRDLVAA